MRLIRLAVAVVACLSMTALPSGSQATVTESPPTVAESQVTDAAVDAAPAPVWVRSFVFTSGESYLVGGHRIRTWFSDFSGGSCLIEVNYTITGFLLCTGQWGVALFDDGSLRVSGIGENRGGYHLYVRPDKTSPAGWEHLGGWLRDYFKFVSVHDKNNFALIGRGSDGETNYCRAYRYPGSGWSGWFTCGN